MNKKMEEILELCLADIKDGRATLDECLSRYAEQARDLEPLLRVAISLRKMSPPQPSEKRVGAGRQRILQEFRTAKPLPWWRRAFAVPALALSAVLTFVLLAVLGTGVFLVASNDGLLASAYPNPAQTQISPTSEPTIAFNGIGLPSEVSGPYEIAGAPDGTLWFAQTDATRVGSVNATDGQIQDWSVASNAGRAAGITVDSAGKVWFTVSSSQSVVALDPQSNQISSWRVPPGDGTLGRITAGRDGRIWFIARNGSRIYSLESETDKFTAYEVDGAQYLEWANDTLWFSGQAGKLGKITSEGQVQMLDVPGSPAAMVWDGESLWYAGGTLIGQLNAASDKVNTFALESETADRIATDGLGNIWFGSQGGTQLGVLQSQSGQISMRSLDTVVQNLYWLAVGNDKVWMSDSDSSFIYAFSLSTPGEVSLSSYLGPQADRFMAALSLPSLAGLH
jgi:streptogramin lyase